MYISKQSLVDANLVVAASQNVTATDVGKNAGGSAIVLDLDNFKNQALMLNVRANSSAANTDFAIDMEYCNAQNFSSGVIAERAINDASAAARTTAFAFNPVAITPKARYVRIKFNRTNGSYTGLDAWLTPAC
jgi:hypothetical protein